MDSLSIAILLFICSGIIIWYCSNKLSDVVDYVDDTFNLGAAFGGTIILSIATNLPELAIVVQGVIKGDLAISIGNILGGIALQTILLSLFDFSMRKKETLPLTSLVSNPTSILQGTFLIAILGIVVMGTQISKSKVNDDFPIAEILILGFWLLSLILIHKGKSTMSSPQSKTISEKVMGITLNKTSSIILLLTLGVLILVFGYTLGNTSDVLAKRFNINGVIFGATILAFVTCLPEISGGLAFVKQKNYQPIISDIFGGNAFLPVLFLIASIINRNSLLPYAENSDIYLTSLSIVLTTIYLVGMVLKPKKRIAGMGVDAFFALIIYGIGIVCLAFVG